MPTLAYTQHTPGKGLSYSKLQLAQLCPRKFQLEEVEGFGVREENIDFAFGHAVGAGVQALIENPNDLNRAMLTAIAHWNVDFWDEDSRKKKSLFYAVEAIRKFSALIHFQKTVLNNYEIAYFANAEGKLVPAIELTFQIQCHEGYIYEGHIDLVLKEKSGDKYLILELKTSGFNNLHEAMYKNSFQALGYSVVLDSIAKDMGVASSYHVLYLIYKSGAQGYEWMLFPKSRSERIEFINDIILDIEILEIYRELGHYPKRGQACFNFFRPCAYLDHCGMHIETLRKLLGNKDTPSQYEELHKPDFVYTLDEIKAHQTESIIPTKTI